MPVIRPPILGDANLDSWTNQVTQQINTLIVTQTSAGASADGAAGVPGADGADGVSAPHYSEVFLYTDPAVSSPPSAPTATITWFTGVLSSITAGWSQEPPTIDAGSTDTVYYSKIIFKDSIAPFATTTETGNTPVAMFDFTNIATDTELAAVSDSIGAFAIPFAATRTGTGVTLSSTYQSLTVDNVYLANASFYSLASNVVTIAATGIYELTVNVSAVRTGATGDPQGSLEIKVTQDASDVWTQSSIAHEDSPSAGLSFTIPLSISVIDTDIEVEGRISMVAGTVPDFDQGDTMVFLRRIADI